MACNTKKQQIWALACVLMTSSSSKWCQIAICPICAYFLRDTSDYYYFKGCTEEKILAFKEGLKFASKTTPIKKEEIRLGSSPFIEYFDSEKVKGKLENRLVISTHTMYFVRTSKVSHICARKSHF